ncbi:Capsule polysaccharide export protein [Castellaniella defragrans 65Phen]|uniref:Capsule polysaccharide export protein n=2 Tax=Castellaniella defragrans TaxID=75697 RepID=W8X064_CASD6|nr:Capsule polysaccharide export protein [Castellaniella defragrans 65Phen]
MLPMHGALRKFLGLFLSMACWGAFAQAVVPPATVQAPPALTQAGAVAAPLNGAAVSTIGPGDVLQLLIYGQPELNARITVTQDGEITVPFLGVLRVDGQSPSAVARRIEKGLRDGGFLRDPQVSIEVAQVRSRVVSVLGQVERAGRYAIEGHLSLLELLAQAGGLRNDAAETLVVMRQSGPPDAGRQRIEVALGSRTVPSPAVQDLQLQPGDVVYVPLAPRFFVYGEVGHPGAYPMEKDMNVMRAVSLAGGLNPRASDSRISISRNDEKSGKLDTFKVDMGDPVLPGDVIHVDERWF